MSQEIIESPSFRATAPTLPGRIFGKSPKAAVTVGRKQEELVSGSALGLEGITLSFGGVKAISNVSFQIARGEIAAIIGPNGAGKSSLINLISGIYQPNQGRIHLAGKPFKRVPTQKLARLGISRTFQNLALFKGLTVFQNIAIARVKTNHATFIEQLVGIGRARQERRDAHRRTEKIIDFLDLRASRDRFIGTLPYGIQKRVELARALVAEPRILLLDEPMAGMTPTEKQEMTRFIRAARDEFGTTVILIEHDIGVVMGLSDRVVVFDYGIKIADGTPDEIKSNHAVIDAYMGVAHEEEN